MVILSFGREMPNASKVALTSTSHRFDEVAQAVGQGGCHRVALAAASGALKSTL